VFYERNQQFFDFTFCRHPMLQILILTTMLHDAGKAFSRMGKDFFRKFQRLVKWQFLHLAGEKVNPVMVAWRNPLIFQNQTVRDKINCSRTNQRRRFYGIDGGNAKFPFCRQIEAVEWHFPEKRIKRLPINDLLRKTADHNFYIQLREKLAPF
jgi:hypothetical protein